MPQIALMQPSLGRFGHHSQVAEYGQLCRTRAPQGFGTRCTCHMLQHPTYVSFGNLSATIQRRLAWPSRRDDTHASSNDYPKVRWNISVARLHCNLPCDCLKCAAESDTARVLHLCIVNQAFPFVHFLKLSKIISVLIELARSDGKPSADFSFERASL